MAARGYGFLRGVAALTLVAALTGCATAPAGSGVEPNDPLEPFNRAVFGDNMALDRQVVKPVAKAYRTTLPQWVRDRLRNFFDNLTEPRVFIHNFLQVRPNAAGTTFARFLMNSTVGLAGFFDIATKNGLPRQSGDFGQTLHKWGFPEGPYLVLPLFGPSNLRDTVGLGGDLYLDFFVDPAGYLVTGAAGTSFDWGRAVTSGVDTRSRNIESFDELQASSLDLYAQMRSITRQRRQAELQEAMGIASQPPPALLDPGATSPELLDPGAASAERLDPSVPKN